MKRSPIVWGTFFFTSRYCCGDIACQVIVEDNDRYDWTRTSIFTLFGFAMGLPASIWYVRALPRLQSVSRQVIADLTIFCPAVYYPLFYITSSLVVTRSLDPQTLQHGLSRYMANFVPDMTALTSFWGPAHALNFYFMPLHLRVPFISAVGFFWAVCLSKIRGKAVSKSSH